MTVQKIPPYLLMDFPHTLVYLTEFVKSHILFIIDFKNRLQLVNDCLVQP